MAEMTPEEAWQERLWLRALDPAAVREGTLLEAIRTRAMAEVYWPHAAPVVLPKDLGQLYRFVADRIGPVHIDLDLYSSALCALASLWQVIDEFYIIFDDFIHEDVTALRDFMRAFPIEIEFIAQTGVGEAESGSGFCSYQARLVQDPGLARAGIRAGVAGRCWANDAPPGDRGSDPGLGRR